MNTSILTPQPPQKQHFCLNPGDCCLYWYHIGITVFSFALSWSEMYHLIERLIDKLSSSSSRGTQLSWRRD